MLSNSFAYSPNPYGPEAFQGGPFHQQFGQQGGFGANPYLQGAPWNSQGAPQWSPQSHYPGQQIVPVLGQIAQQIAVQSALTQQLGYVLHQLVHQLSAQGAQNQLGFGQQGFGQQGFVPFNPQAQAWGANRAATIQ
jgi:hypothetical protein